MSPTLPKVSYHGCHSGDFCAHAESSKSEMIASYVAKGFKSFAVTEHVPPPDDSLVYDDERAQNLSAAVLNSRFDKYFFELIPTLRATYQNQAEIFFGFEAEYHGPDPCGRVSFLAARYKPEIIVVSVHHVRNHPYDITAVQFQAAVAQVGGLEDFYQAYFDHQHSLLSHLLKHHPNIPLVVGHLDLPKLFADKIHYSSNTWALIDRTIQLAAANNVPIEVNTHGFKKGLGEPYPSLEILQRVASLGGIITLSDDSHRLNEVGHFWDETGAVIGSVYSKIAVLNYTTKKWELVAL